MSCNQFAFFPFKHIKYLHQLEHDMTNLPGITVPARPIQSGQQLPAKLDASFPGVRQKAGVLAEWMKGITNTVTKKYWPLNQKLCVDWRQESKSHNVKRDYVKFAVFTLIEIGIVNKYRQQLLEQSAAAAYLHHALQETLGRFCIERRVKYVEDKAAEPCHGWVYPDLIQSPTQDPPLPPVVNIKQLMKIRKESSAEENGRKALVAIVQKVQSLPIVAAYPNATPMDHDVRYYLDKLIMVCTAALLLLLLCLMHNVTGCTQEHEATCNDQRGSERPKCRF